MKRKSVSLPALIGLCLAGLAAAQTAAPAASVAPAARHIEGRLPSGASTVYDVPGNWNGTVLLYSHGYAPGPANPARNVASTERDALLARGYALIGSSFSSTGWALAEAVPDQLATLDAFARDIGPPKRVLAWGSSMGGLVTVALMERHPERFDGGLALCASLAGTLGMMNAALDGAYVFKTLVAPQSALPVLFDAVGAAAAAQRAEWQRALDAAQATPEGRARIALAATLAQVPVWNDGTKPPPADSDFSAQQQQQQRGFIAATLLPRDDQQRRAGGNFSWNTGVDYAAQLQASGRAAFVQAVYAQAGLDLAADLATLARAPRTAAQPSAVAHMQANYVPSGELRRPLLALQTVADPVTLVELTGDYVALVARAGRADLARGAYIQRAGHCNFTQAETLAAVQAVEDRIEQGRWDVAATALNRSAGRLANDGSAYADFQPQPFLRACSARPGGCPGVNP